MKAIILFVFFSLVIIGLYFRSPTSNEPEKTQTKQKKTQKKLEQQKKKFETKETLASKTRSPSKKDPSPSEKDKKSKEEFVDAKTLSTEEILEKSSIFSAKSLVPALNALKMRPKEEIAQTFMKGLDEAASNHDSALRERITWFASKLGYTELVPFWEDLLERKTPRFQDEEEHIKAPFSHRNYARTVILSEQRLAIEALAQESTQNEFVQKKLNDILLGKNKNAFSGSLETRKTLLFELAKYNKIIIKQIIYQLSEKDPLREIIINHLEKED